MDCAVGRPEGVVGARCEMEVIFCGLVVAPVAGSKSASQTCWPPLRAAEEEDALAVGGELRAAVAGLGYG